MNEQGKKIELSVLDLSPVPSGSTATDALHNTIDLAKLADELRYKRYWLAEHHNTDLLACPAPEIMIGHVAAVTKNIRVGSGGVMLPNHSPLKVAENFNVLQALYPGRIDLGIGRAPGTDRITALALRRAREVMNADDFPQQMEELLGFFNDEFPPENPFRRVHAIPRGVGQPEIWLLGSSDFSARMAAEMGLSFAFAHHISPAPALMALTDYHESFKPSRYLDKPNAMIAVSVICAETDEEAERLAQSADLVWLRFSKGQHSLPFPSVEEAEDYPYTDLDLAVIYQNRERLLVGSPALIKKNLELFSEKTGANEIMVMTMIHDHALRRRSYELLAQEFNTSNTNLIGEAHYAK
jgi:luciferase family oxidoreductase group 1